MRTAKIALQIVDQVDMKDPEIVIMFSVNEEAFLNLPSAVAQELVAQAKKGLDALLRAQEEANKDEPSKKRES